MSNRKYIISVGETDPNGVRQIADRLRQAGFKVERELTATGIITGSAEETQVNAFRRIKGVIAIEEEGVYQLPPPDSDIL